MKALPFLTPKIRVLFLMAQPKAKPGALPKENEKNTDECDLGNCGVARPPPAEGEKITKMSPFRSQRGVKIHCAPSAGNKNRSYASTNFGMDQGSLGGTNLARIGPEKLSLPPL